jgi:RHS repeat-associated protein
MSRRLLSRVAVGLAFALLSSGGVLADAPGASGATATAGPTSGSKPIVEDPVAVGRSGAPTKAADVAKLDPIASTSASRPPAPEKPKEVWPSPTFGGAQTIPVTTVPPEAPDSERTEPPGAGQPAPSKFDPKTSVEDEDKRTATSSTFKNADGSFTANISPVPVHYRNKNRGGKFDRIDDSLVDDAGDFRTAANEWTARFKPLPAGVVMELADGSKVKLSPADARSGVKPVRAKDGKTIVYPDAYPGVDLQYSITPSGVKEDVILKSSSTSSAFEFDYSGVDLVPSTQVPGGFVDRGRDEQSFFLAAPVIVDVNNAQYPVASGAKLERVDTAQAMGSSKTSRMRLSVDPVWLKALDPSVFPISIDPSATLSTYRQEAFGGDNANSSAGNGSICPSNPTCTYSRTGNSWTLQNPTNVIWRSMSQFNYAPYLPSPANTPNGVFTWVTGARFTATNVSANTASQYLVLRWASAYSFCGVFVDNVCPHPPSSVPPAMYIPDLARVQVGGGAATFDVTNVLQTQSPVRQWAPGMGCCLVGWALTGEEPGNANTYKEWSTSLSIDYFSEPAEGAIYTPASTIPGLSPTTPGTLSVDVKNTGMQTWTPPNPAGYQLGSHLYDSAGNLVNYEFSALNFPTTVAPNTTAAVILPIPSVPPGSYRLDLDVVRRGYYWLASRPYGAASPVSSVTFTVRPSVQPGLSAVFPSNGLVNSTPSSTAGVQIPVNATPGAVATMIVCDNQAMSVGCSTSTTPTQVSFPSGAGTVGVFSGQFGANGIPLLSLYKQRFWAITVSQNGLLAGLGGPYGSGFDGPLGTGKLGQPVIMATSAPLASSGGGGGQQVMGVNTNNLTFSVDTLDANLLGQGPAARVKRTYNSGSDSIGIFGPGWLSDFDTRLSFDIYGNATVLYWDGHAEVWGRGYIPATAICAPGAYCAPFTAPPGTLGQLSADSTYTPTGYRLVTSAGSTYDFDGSGRLKSVTNNAGQILQLNYTGNQLTQVINPVTGRDLAFTWTNSRVTKVTTPTVAANGAAAYTWTYEYDALARLSKVHDPVNPLLWTEYAYNANNLLTKVVLPSGLAWRQIAYGTTKVRGVYPVISATDEAGKIWQYSSVNSTDPNTLAPTPKTSVIYPNGVVHYWEYTGGSYGGLSKICPAYNTSPTNCSTQAYDANGFINQTVDLAGRSTTLVNDAQGRTLTKTGPGPGTRFFSYPAFDSANPGDPRNTLPTSVADERSTDASDARYRTLYEYTTPADGVRGLLKKTTNPFGVVSETRTYTTAATPPVGGGTVSVAGLLLTVANATGQVTTYGYDAKGDQKTVNDPAGLATVNSFDEEGRLIQSVVTWENGSRTDTVKYDGLDRAMERTGPSIANPVTNLTHQARVSTTFTLDGKVLKQTVADVSAGDAARVTTYGYDAAGRNNTITDPAGQITTRTYDVFGRVLTEQAPGAPLLTYSYDHPLDVVTKVTAASYTHPYSTAIARNVLVAQYQYDAAGVLIRETDALGHVVRHDYRGDLLPTADVLENYQPPTGATRAYTITGTDYDNAGNATHATNLDGTRHNYQTFDANNRVLTTSPTVDCSQLCSRNVYDTAGRATRLADDLASPTKEVTFTYDTVGRLATRSVRQTVGPTPNYATTSYTYDRRNLTTSITDPAGYVRTISYDAVGRETSSSRAGITIEQNQVSTTAQTIAATLGYDTFGAVTQTRDTRNNTTTNTYDVDGRLIKIAKPPYQQPGGALLTPSRTATYNATTGLPSSATDWSGRVTSYEYDSFGRLARQVDPIQTGAATAPQTLLYTDDLGRTNRTVTPTGAERTQTFDDLGRPRTTTIKERQPSTVGVLTTSYTYNESTGTVSVTNPTGATSSSIVNSFGQLIRQVDGTGRGIDYLYDKWGRTAADFDADHAITHDYYYDAADRVLRSSRYVGVSTVANTDFAYDARGFVTAKTDGIGATTRMTYDARGLMTSLAEPVTASTGLTTTLGYDAAGNNTRRTNSAGAVTWTTFNPWQQPESTIEPSTTTYPAVADRTFTTGYSADGDVISEIEPGNITRAYTYLTAGQLGAVTSKLGATTSAAVTYSRDLLGRQTSAVSGGAPISTVFNDRDQPVTVTNGTNITNYTYDNASRLASRADQAGTTAFTYDNANRLATLADPLTGTTSSYAYDSKGRLGTQTSGATIRAFTYDQASRTVSDTTKTSAGTVTLSTTNVWDNADRLTGRTTGPAGASGAGTETFGYDLASRLTTWTNQANVATTYAWGPTGNRSAAGTSAYSYNERDQLVSQTVAGVTTSYTYQANGSQTAATTGATTVTRSYDGLGRQTQVGATIYSYDALGRLTNGGTATLAYPGLDQEPVNDSGTLYSRTPAGTIIGTKTGTVATLVETNGHGDVAATINPTTAAPTGQRTYDPFGVPVVATTTGRAGYQSQWTDPTTGDIHAQARNYSPSTARFTTRDTWTLPTTNAANINRYTYAQANPITGTDPSGHIPCSLLSAIFSPRLGGPPSPPTTPPPAAQPCEKTPAPGGSGRGPGVDGGAGASVPATTPSTYDPCLNGGNSQYPCPNTTNPATTNPATTNPAITPTTPATRPTTPAPSKPATPRPTVPTGPTPGVATTDPRMPAVGPDGASHPSTGTPSVPATIAVTTSTPGTTVVPSAPQPLPMPPIPTGASECSKQGGCGPSSGPGFPTLPPDLAQKVICASRSGGDPVLYVICSADALASQPNGQEIRDNANKVITFLALTTILSNRESVCKQGAYGLTVCQVPPSLSDLSNGGGGATYGSVYATTANLDSVINDDDLLFHESRHAYQWAAGGFNGVGFAELYSAEEARSKAQYAAYLKLGGTPFVSGARCFQRFEQAANLDRGHYNC